MEPALPVGEREILRSVLAAGWLNSVSSAPSAPSWVVEQDTQCSQLGG